MNCKIAENILLEENLGQNLSNELLEHIANCDNCHKYYLAESAYSKIANSVNELSPKLNHFQIEAEVLKSIKNGPSARAKYAFLNLSDRIMLNNGVRLAFTIILLLIVSFYFWEEYSAVSQIRKLEQKYSTQNKTEFSNAYSSAGTFEHMEMLLESIAGKIKITSPSSNNVIIHEEEYLELLSLLIKNEAINNNELKNILAKWNVNIFDGLNADELKKVISRKDLIKKILTREFNNGGN